MIGRLLGVYVIIVSYCDWKFTSAFWRAFQKALRTWSTWVHRIICRQIVIQRELFRPLRTCSKITFYGVKEARKASISSKVAYIDNYHPSIKMIPYEALYGWPCRIPLYWVKVEEQHVIELAMIQERVEEMDMLKVCLRKPVSVRGVMQLHA